MICVGDGCCYCAGWGRGTLPTCWLSGLETSCLGTGFPDEASSGKVSDCADCSPTLGAVLATGKVPFSFNSGPPVRENPSDLKT